jgi:hypothetical protein
MPARRREETIQSLKKARRRQRFLGCCPWHNNSKQQQHSQLNDLLHAATARERVFLSHV